MSNKIRTNFWTDVMIFVCLVGVAVTGFSLEGEHDRTNGLRNVHSGLGLTIATLGLVHLVLHWRWWINALRRFTQLNPPVRTNFVIDCILFVLFTLITITGFCLWQGESTHFLLAAHSMIAFLILITAITHIVKHWKWITSTTRRIFAARPAAQSPARPARKSGSRP